MSKPIVTVRFYEELNDFLPPERRKRSFAAPFHKGDTAKALIEALGVPHTEVDLILANGQSVPFDYRLRGGDHLSVFPVFESLDISSVTRVRPRPLRQTRFVLDVHLGRLAKSLRLLGFDSLYATTMGDATLSRISRREGRILLTRDRGLLKRALVDHGYCVRSPRPPEQLGEVVRRFDLLGQVRPFSRCLRCNVPLRRISRRRARPRVPAYVARAYRHFRACPSCGRVYWQGTHWEAMNALLERVLSP
jgi:uncharacterized protein with PIN domain